MIKAGTLCVWQECSGPIAHLNGSDVIAESGLKYKEVFWGSLGKKKVVFGYETDYIIPFHGREGHLFAMANQLREKFPPQDEEDLIKEKELENG